MVTALVVQLGCFVQDLGWSTADTEALFPSSATPAADAANGSKGKPTAAAKKPAASSSADKKTTAAAEGQPAIMTDVVVSGLETPCHVSAVRCHNAAVAQVKAELSAAAMVLKTSMYAWQRNEAANKERWATSLSNLGDLV